MVSRTGMRIVAHTPKGAIERTFVTPPKPPLSNSQKKSIADPSLHLLGISAVTACATAASLWNLPDAPVPKDPLHPFLSEIM